MPLSIRAKGASLSTATNWAFNWLVGMMTPVLQEWITWRLYLIHAFSCACSFVAVYFLYPETKGVMLEDMDAVFGDQTVPATPATARDALLSGSQSPVPSMDLNRASSPSGIKQRRSTRADARREGGVGGMFRAMFKKQKENDSGGNYRQLGDDDDV